MIQFTTLSDKAMLAKLSQHSLGDTKVESQLTEQLQTAQNDKGLRVMSKLFQDKNNPVHQLKSLQQEQYVYHTTNTLPFEDGGSRLLPNSRYLDYSQGMAAIRAKFDKWRQDHLSNYDAYVLQDIAYRRTKGSGISAIDPADYPSVGRIVNVLEPKVVLKPLPTSHHFVYDISDEDRKNFEESQLEQFKMAQMDAIARVTRPLEKLISKLETYGGIKSGERFHESLVKNILQGASEAKNLTIDAAPEYVEQLDDLLNKANALSVDGLRENEFYRKDVKEDLGAMARKLSVFAPQI